MLPLHLSFVLSASGHVLVLYDTDRKLGSESSLLSPFMNTTGMCMELFYHVLGDNVTVKVILQREDKLQREIIEVLLRALFVCSFTNLQQS